MREAMRTLGRNGLVSTRLYNTILTTHPPRSRQHVTNTWGNAPRISNGVTARDGTERVRGLLGGGGRRRVELEAVGLQVGRRDLDAEKGTALPLGTACPVQVDVQGPMDLVYDVRGVALRTQSV